MDRWIIAFIVLIVLWKVYWKIWHWSPSAGAVLTICGVMAAFLTTRK